MIILGLTGSIGMGKSTAAKMLGRLGCGVFDSDLAAYDAVKPTGEAFEAVALTFPQAWNKKGHFIDRQILGNLVFSDGDARIKLEAILHPLIENKQYQYIKAQAALGRKFVVLDIPLLFETDAQDRVDYSIVVTAPEFIQRQRVLTRANMTIEKFYNILNNQMPDSQKQALADFVVPTGLGMAHSYRCLRNILKEVSAYR